MGLTAAIAALSAGLLINYARTKSVILLEKAKVVWDGIQAGATWLLTGAQLAFNTALWACPLTWVAAAIGAVVAAIVYCWQKFEGFRRVIYGCWETVKEFGRVLIDSIVAPFKQVLGGLGKVCSALVSLVRVISGKRPKRRKPVLWISARGYWVPIPYLSVWI